MGKLALEGVEVLVVDDHEDTLEIMRLLLQSLGARVRVATDGHLALQMARQLKPHVILSDLVMPRMDGVELVKRLRADAKLCRVPVLAVSGRDSRPNLMQSWEAGFDGHLVKPVSPQALESHLARVFWAHARRAADQRTG